MQPSLPQDSLDIHSRSKSKQKEGFPSLEWSRWDIFLILVMIGLFSLLSWPALVLLGDIYSVEDDYSHGFMVPLVSAYALYQIHQENRLILRPSWLGIFVLGLGITILLGAHWYYIALFPQGLGVGFVYGIGILWMIVGFSLVYGGFRSLRLFSFPIIYLIFAIPFPKSMTLPLTLTLRSLVSSFSEIGIRLLGITVYREGNVLYLANASLGVEDACSGIRSFWILMAGAAALGFVLRLGKIKSVTLCLLTLPISVLMNILRVVVTALLVSNFGIEYASGWRHDMCGWVTFVLGLAMMMVIAWWWAAPQKFQESYSEHNELKEQDKNIFDYLKKILHQRKPHAMAITLLLASGLSAQHFITNYYDSDDRKNFLTRKEFSVFPERLDSYVKVKDGSIPESHLEILKPTDYIIRYYQNTTTGNIVELRAIYWKPLQYRRKEFNLGINNHIPDVCYPSWGFEKRFSQEESIGGIKHISVRHFQKNNEEQCVIFWYVGGGGILKKKEIQKRIRYLLDSWKNPFINHGSQYIVTIVVRVTDSFEEAKEKASHFAKEIEPFLTDFGIDSEEY